MDVVLRLRRVEFGLAGLGFYLPIFWLLPSPLFCASRPAVAMGASLFWFVFMTVLVNLAWSYDYRFFYPGWMR